MYRVVAELLFILSYLFATITCESSQSLTVHLPQGPVRGYKHENHGIYIFYNIPYATAPTGPDRFKGPLPPPIWFDLFEAVDKQIICPQGNLMGLFSESQTMKEDCLIANIYVPETKENNLPVVVYVHGGAYILGWGDLATPKNLVKSKKIIAVTFNYRLGPHGFLCLGTKDVPGNAGMKDQVTLLRWVNKNIAKFGGNPEDVTIAGYSAGSSSVDLLMISKLTNNLFKKVIPESGANIAAFSVQSDPIKNAKEYAKLIGFDNIDDFNALEHFYKTVSYSQLNSANVMNLTNSIFLMSPCVERNLGGEIFLDDSPFHILKNFKKVPMLYGFANMEGLFRIPLFDHWKDLMNAKFSDFLPADLKFTSEIEKGQIAERIKKKYFGENLITEKNVLNYVDYFTDIIFAYPTLRSVKLQVEAGNDQIYLYYSYFDDSTPVVPYTNTRGANHCAQTLAVLDGFSNSTVSDDKDISDGYEQHRSAIRDMWLNFITTGKPVPADSSLPQWRPVGADWSPHMSLSKIIQLKGSLLKERSKFWEEIYGTYYWNPVPPAPQLKHTEL